MDHPAPIALFVYNRPDHTRRTVEALQKNDLAAMSRLIIFADAPKTGAEVESVAQVREYIAGIKEFSVVEIICRDSNYGLARSIVDGVSEVLGRFDRVIVLEDDIVTSPYFLRYINDALHKYREVEEVMHISGYMFPIETEGLPETFFYRVTSCWGWGTWGRAWKHFSKDPRRQVGQFSREAIGRFSLNGATDHWQQFLRNLKGRSDTWAVFWYVSVFQRGGLCLHPAVSLTEISGMTVQASIAAGKSVSTGFWL